MCHFSWLLYHVSSIIACKSVLDAKKTMRTMKTSDGMLESGDGTRSHHSEAVKLGRTNQGDINIRNTDTNTNTNTNANS